MAELSREKKAEILNKPYNQEYHKALIEQKRAKNIKLSKKTILIYLYELMAFYNYLELDPKQKPSIEQAEQWREYIIKKYARKTVAKQIVSVNHYLHYCCGYPKNTLEQVPNISRKSTPLKLSREEIMEMIELLKSKNKHTDACLVFTCFVTSTRKGVLHRIKLSDLDFENNIITLKECKRDLDHKVPMNKNDMAIIKEYIDKYRPQPIKEYEDYLFITDKGKKVYEDRLRDALLYCGRKLNSKTRRYPHALRRGRIRDLRGKDYQWEEIMQVSGHRNLSSLLIYLEEEEFEKVQEKLNNGNVDPEPQEVPSKMTDIDKELELIKKKIELAKLEKEKAETEKENLQAKLSLKKDLTFKSVVGQTGYG